MSEDAGRSASREELHRFNAAARAGGYEHVAADEILDRLPDGARALGSVIPGPEGQDVVLTTWMIASEDVLSVPIEHVLIDVSLAEYQALPGWEEAPPVASGPGADTDERVWPLAVLIGLPLAALVAWVAGDSALLVGAVLAGAGVLALVASLTLSLIDSRRADYWDALDEFFGQLELIFVGGAGLVLLILGGMVAALSVVI